MQLKNVRDTCAGFNVPLIGHWNSSGFTTLTYLLWYLSEDEGGEFKRL